MTDILFAIYKCNLCGRLKFVDFPINEVLRRHVIHREYDHESLYVASDILSTKPAPRIVQHVCVEDTVIGIAEYVGYSTKEKEYIDLS